MTPFTSHAQICTPDVECPPSPPLQAALLGAPLTPSEGGGGLEYSECAEWVGAQVRVSLYQSHARLAALCAALPLADEQDSDGLRALQEAQAPLMGGQVSGRGA
jgi:hypothetical protein